MAPQKWPTEWVAQLLICANNHKMSTTARSRNTLLSQLKKKKKEMNVSLDFNRHLSFQASSVCPSSDEFISSSPNMICYIVTTKKKHTHSQIILIRAGDFWSKCALRYDYYYHGWSLSNNHNEMIARCFRNVTIIYFFFKCSGGIRISYFQNTLIIEENFDYWTSTVQ